MTSRELTDTVIVALDEMDMVVGIEVLRLDAELPYERLCEEFHVHSAAVEVLKQIRPSVAGLMSLTAAPDGTSRGADRHRLVAS